MMTTCEECGYRVELTTVYEGGILIGDECPHCGYWVSRYMPGMKPKGI